MNSYSRSQDIINVIKGHLKQLGFDNLEISQGYDIDGYTLYFDQKLPRMLIRNDAETIAEVCKPMFESFYNSPEIARIKAEHQKDIAKLEQKIKELEKQNMDLSEAFTNGIEYLESK